MGPRLAWIIIGGESGPRARPSHPQWFRDAIAQCEAAGTPAFFKQWGEWAPTGEWTHGVSIDGRLSKRADVIVTDGTLVERDHRQIQLQGMAKVGKANAGRLLDGREYNGFPGSR